MFASQSLIDYRNKLAELEKAVLNSEPKNVILENSSKPNEVRGSIRNSIIISNSNVSKSKLTLKFEPNWADDLRKQVLHEPMVNGTLLAFKGYFNRGKKITSNLKGRMIVEHLSVFKVIRETETLEYLGHIDHLWFDRLWIVRELQFQGQPLPRITGQPLVLASAHQYRNNSGGFDYGLRSNPNINNLSVNHYRISHSVFDEKVISISTN